MDEQKLKYQYQKEHPERIGETEKEFAMSNYIEWLENKLVLNSSPVQEETQDELWQEVANIIAIVVDPHSLPELKTKFKLIRK